MRVKFFTNENVRTTWLNVVRKIDIQRHTSTSTDRLHELYVRELLYSMAGVEILRRCHVVQDEFRRQNWFYIELGIQIEF